MALTLPQIVILKRCHYNFFLCIKGISIEFPVQSGNAAIFPFLEDTGYCSGRIASSL